MSIRPIVVAIVAAACCSAPTAIVAAAPAAFLAATDAAPSDGPLGPPITDAVTRERLEAMIARGHDAVVVQTFRRHPGRVLGFIDGYLEEGLAKLEAAGDTAGDGLPDAVRDLYGLALKFAELADRAFGDTIFMEYSATFAGWSPIERVRFRAGQRLHREARRTLAEDPARALDLHRRSLMLAESVGDHWGMVMAYDGIATAATKAERFEEAHEMAIKAVSLNGRLQLRENHIRSMLAAGRLQARMQLPGGGIQYLLLARQILPLEASTELRAEIVETLLNALEAAGRGAEADRIRTEEGRRSEVLGDAAR